MNAFFLTCAPDPFPPSTRKGLIIIKFVFEPPPFAYLHWTLAPWVEKPETGDFDANPFLHPKCGGVVRSKLWETQMRLQRKRGVGAMKRPYKKGKLLKPLASATCRGWTGIVHWRCHWKLGKTLHAQRLEASADYMQPGEDITWIIAIYNVSSKRHERGAMKIL